MRQSWLALLPLFLAALLGAAACLFVQALSTSGGSTHAHGGAGMVADYHDWIHAQLEISPKQDAALAPLEKDFEEQRALWKERIRKANVELGDAMEQDKAKTARVEAILGRIHEGQKAIQEATILHFFEMKEHLTEEQFDKLLGLMTDALRGAPHSHSD